MKKEDLIIGKEYWLNNTKTEKGTYVGTNQDTYGIYFKPSGKTYFIKYTGLQKQFEGCVGFTLTNLITPVQP